MTIDLTEIRRALFAMATSAAVGSMLGGGLVWFMIR
jgi:hypothetical protein